MPRTASAQRAVQQAMASKPTPSQIRRVMDAFLSQDSKKIQEFDYGPWKVRLYKPSPYGDDKMLVCADHPATEPGGVPPAALAQEVSTLDEARVWVRGLTR